MTTPLSLKITAADYTGLDMEGFLLPSGKYDDADPAPHVKQFDRLVKELIADRFNSLIDEMHPIGSIYMSVDNASPATLFGGTWAAWGAGRVPVGVDTTQTEFDTVEETGGHKATEAHAHNTGINTGAAYAGTAGSEFLGASGGTPAGQLTSTFGTGNAGNLQPYITCYMWKRTA